MADPSSSDSLSILKHTRRKRRSPKHQEHEHEHEHEQGTTKKTHVSDSRAHLKSPTLVAKQLKKIISSPSTSGVFDAKGKFDSSFSSTPNSIIRQTPKSVSLYDWWLIKVDGEGKGLGIEGFTFGLNPGVRIFTSAAISARHCETIVETTDGITVQISGLLNTCRTCQNGFPSKLCSNFMNGFPYNWEDFSTGFRDKESNEINKFLESLSSNNLPVTATDDLLRATFGHSSCDLIIENICSNLRSALGNSKRSKATEDPKKTKSESRRRPIREECRVTRSMSKRNRSGKRALK